MSIERKHLRLLPSITENEVPPTAPSDVYTGYDDGNGCTIANPPSEFPTEPTQPAVRWLHLTVDTEPTDWT
ncbi:MAG TPA: hypothetical protein VK983_02550 [Candidatus Limnocylindrales bacterium]|nr:hypothetical protein [Candidatus Limnocylindrales bacterium]